MRIYDVKQSRENYFKTQIEASEKKFRYCKVSINCAKRFKEIIRRSNKGNIDGPILCLGTRNGREIDIFRKIFFGGRLTELIIGLFEKREYAFSSRCHWFESAGKNDIRHIDNKSVVGIELNPQGSRKDVLTGSFDELPLEWTSKFKIIYANTLDHAYDVFQTAREWNRVVVPGGYIIIGYPPSIEASNIGYVGDITLDGIKELFPGEVIYFNKFGNAFGDVIIKTKN